MSGTKEKLIKKLDKFPVRILVVLNLLCLYGFLLLYSASGGELKPWAYKQISIFVIYLPITIFIAFIDIKFIYNYTDLLYIFTILLLIIVEVAGKTSMGATRWIDIGIIRLQPSELAKISIVLMLAKYLHQLKGYDINSPKNLIAPILIVVIPAGLIIKQPDLGTGVITLLVAGIVIFAAGLRLIYFISIGIIGIISMPIIWLLLHPYQKKRVEIFLSPELDPLGAGYNIIQSKIAIGSGGLTGKGFLSGTQSHLSFLPEYQTDFIFSFLTEELGFVGGLTLLILYSILIIFSLAVAVNSRTRFAKLMVIGITSIFFCHIFVNISMVMGLLPVVGVPLPLISYGGTMLVTMMVGFGLILNSAVNQHNNV